MCGLSSFFEFESRVNIENLSESLNAISHRGPDGRGEIITKLDNGMKVGQRTFKS